MECPPFDSWEGSSVTLKEIEGLRRARKIPAAERVAVMARSVELTPWTEEGECVVFTSHFLRGLGLPTTRFFRLFLDTFGL